MMQKASNTHHVCVDQMEAARVCFFRPTSRRAGYPRNRTGIEHDALNLKYKSGYVIMRDMLPIPPNKLVYFQNAVTVTAAGSQATSAECACAAALHYLSLRFSPLNGKSELF